MSEVILAGFRDLVRDRAVPAIEYSPVNCNFSGVTLPAAGEYLYSGFLSFPNCRRFLFSMYTVGSSGTSSTVGSTRLDLYVYNKERDIIIAGPVTIATTSTQNSSTLRRWFGWATHNSSFAGDGSGLASSAGQGHVAMSYENVRFRLYGVTTWDNGPWWTTIHFLGAN